VSIGLVVPTVHFLLTFAGIRLNNKPFGTIADLVGLALFFSGAALETISEIQRNQFKSNKANKGKIYTGGLFSFARHINYFGEALWYAGFTLTSTNSALLALFILVNNLWFFHDTGVPEVSAHMEAKYPEQWSQYKADTPYKIVPFIL
jgi:steroid 5-alpha reductase family enzyme